MKGLKKIKSYLRQLETVSFAAYAGLSLCIIYLLAYSSGVDVFGQVALMMSKDKTSEASIPSSTEAILMPKQKEQASPATTDPIVTSKTSDTNSDQVIRIALHPLGHEHLKDTFDDGQERSQFITSQLLISLSKSAHFELLDRSMVSTLFSEKTNLLVGDRSDNQAFFRKLPVSNYVILGELLTKKSKNLISLKLVKSSTGEILGASMFEYSFDNLDDVIAEAFAYIDALVNKQTLKIETANAVTKKKLAVGHFVNIDTNDDSQAHQGRVLTEQLINKYVHQNRFDLLARTQMFPLVFEEYLRELQYIDRQANSTPRTADFLIHGKYRVHGRKPESPLSIYLYIEQLGFARDFIIIQASDWPTAYKKVEDAIENHLPKSNLLVSEHKVAESQNYFLDALKQRGLVKEKLILNGERLPSWYKLRLFVSTKYPERRALARSLIDKALLLNPQNHLAQLSKAIFRSADQDKQNPIKVFKDVMRSADLETSKVAHKLLEQYYKELLKVGYETVLSDVIGQQNAKIIYDALVEKKYLIAWDKSQTKFNYDEKASEVFDFTHLLKLPSTDVDTSIKTFELLRSLNRLPAVQVGYFGPTRFPRNAVTKNRRNSKHNKRYWMPYHVESVLHHNLANVISGNYLNITNKGLATIDTYTEALNQPINIRQSNLEIAADHYAASIFINKTFLKSKALLAHTLCRPIVAKCHSASMIYSWVVDQTEGPKINGSNGVYTNVTQEDKELDRLIYFAATAVNRVEDAKFSDFFQYTIDESDEGTKKKLTELDNILSDEKNNQPTSDVERKMLLIGEQITSHCEKLFSDSRLLEMSKMPIDAMDKLTSFALENRRASDLRKKILANLQEKYPTVYPYLLISASGLSKHVDDEQDEMIRKVSHGETKPLKTDQFMTNFALRLFHRRIAEGKFSSAKAYIDGFIQYYGLSDKTAINIAYLFHQVGDLSQSKQILKKHSRDSMLISNSSLPTLNGVFNQSGFNSKGQLKFLKAGNKNHIFSYDASRQNRTFTESRSLWRLLRGRNHDYANVKNNNPSSGMFFGSTFVDISWPSSGERLADEQAQQAANTFESIALAPLEKDEYITSVNSSEYRFYKGYGVSPSKTTAIKGYPSKATAGIIKDEYFPSYLTQSKRVGVVKEALFREALISVKGVPIFESSVQLRKRLIKALPDYTDQERNGIKKALITASRLNNAGYVEILSLSKNKTQEKSILMPDNPIEHRRFGSAFSVAGDMALICDRKNKIYVFKKTKDTWKVQHSLDQHCTGSLAMTPDWAAIQTKASVDILKRVGNSWQKKQTLSLSDLKRRTGKDIELGAAIAFSKKALYIGNPSGGLDGNGEVYRYELNQNKWLYRSSLKQNNSRHFGASIAVNNKVLAIGAPYSDDGGLAFIYNRDHLGWTLTTRLSPLVTKQRVSFFGSTLELTQAKDTRLLISSSLDIFQYPILKQNQR